jgi:hypothetical protein
MQFSPELRNDVLAGDITLSVRLWKRPRAKQGGAGGTPVLIRLQTDRSVCYDAGGEQTDRSV